MRKRYAIGILVLAVVLVAGIADDGMAQRARSGVAIKDRDRDRDGEPKGQVFRHEFDGKAGGSADADLNRLDVLAEKLELTEEQIATLRPLHEQMVEAGKAYREALRTTLTEEQQAQLRRGFQRQFQNQRPGGPGHPEDAIRQARFWALHQLDLTDEQKADLKAIFDEVREEMRTLFEANKEDKEALRTAVKELHDDVDARVQEILTADQYAEFQSLISAAHKRMGRRDGKGGPGLFAPGECPVAPAKDSALEEAGRHRRAR